MNKWGFFCVVFSMNNMNNMQLKKQKDIIKKLYEQKTIICCASLNNSVHYSHNNLHIKYIIRYREDE